MVTFQWPWHPEAVSYMLHQVNSSSADGEQGWEADSVAGQQHPDRDLTPFFQRP